MELIDEESCTGWKELTQQLWFLYYYIFECQSSEDGCSKIGTCILIFDFIIIQKIMKQHRHNRYAGSLLIRLNRFITVILLLNASKIST